MLPIPVQMQTGRINRSLFVESGTYNDMYLRSFETNFSKDVSDTLIDITDGGSQINANAVAKIAGEILAPQATPSGTISIDNGWKERRLTFMIEATTTSGLGASDSTVVITGYTSHADISPFTNQFDPQMRLYFNTSTIIRNILMRNAVGQSYVRKSLVDTSHILGKSLIDNVHSLSPAYNNYSPYGSNALFWITPKNVIHEMTNGLMAQSGCTDTIIDTRYMSNPVHVVKSKRENSTANNFLSKVVGSVSNEYKQIHHGNIAGEYEALSNASAATADESTKMDPILSLFIRSTNYLKLGYVTWAEFCSIFPNAEEATIFMLRRDAIVDQRNIPVEAGNFQNWNSVSYESVVANIIAQNVPSVMVSSLIGNINFVFTNDTPNMTPQVTIVGANSVIDGLSIADLSGQFTYKFINEVVPLITHNNRAIVTAQINCNIGTETTIQISYNHGDPTPFCSPTFCDAMFAPIIGTDKNVISNIANDLHSFATDIVGQSSLIYQ